MNRFYYLKDNKFNNKSLEELMCMKVKLSHLSIIDSKSKTSYKINYSHN